MNELVIDDQPQPLDARVSLRWVDMPGGPAVPTLYIDGKRVTKSWSLKIDAVIEQDKYGGNANTS